MISVVSVCMAIHNGEAFLSKQLQSILSQLEVHDEVIVVDDASTDRSRQIVENLGDARIKLLTNPTNRG